MQNIFLPIADWLTSSSLRSLSIEWLRNVPGLPPILQSIHILAVAVVIASALLIHSRVLGIAVRSQDINELYQRMRLWFWWSLPTLLLSGILFIFARPYRYFKNPIFGIKILSLALAITLVIYVFHYIKHNIQNNKVTIASFQFKLINMLAIVLWVTVIFSGRWIAYVDYLFVR